VSEFLHARAVLAEAAPLRVRRFAIPDDGGELLRISQTRLDERRRLMEVEFELIELRSDGSYERWRESQSNRFFHPSEIESLLERAGLRTARFGPAYREGGDIDDQTFHVIVVARERQ
jgi:hypothetical protein